MDPRSRWDDDPSPLRDTPQRGGAAGVTVRPVMEQLTDPIYEWAVTLPSLLAWSGNNH